MSVTIGDLEFSSKQAAQDYTRSVLDEIGRGVSIYPSHPRFPFFNSLLNNHSDRPRKEGTGISSFGIQRNARDGRNHETYIIRTDGTKETFSWKDCAGKTSLTNEQKLKKAYRCSIDSQIEEYRKSQPNRCVLCNSTDQLSVDHKEPTFYVLMKTFQAQTSLLVPTVFDKQAKTNAEIFRATDKPFEDAWIDYHKIHAVLQILCDACHKTKTVEDNKANKVFREAHQSSAIAHPADNDTSAALG
jgi:5-methylcytosine-specific restriction endonuclease McrA